MTYTKHIKQHTEELVLMDEFSGIGGFHLGLEDAGIKFSDVYFSEVDKHCIANYNFHFPNATYIGSIEEALGSGAKRPNIITFGSPCQDFSIAGERVGLSGEKSCLIKQAIATISHYRPDIFVWENVKGAFSSNNRADFWAIIQAFADIGGYEIEWQLLNTAWILPQNRERIYLIGHLATRFPNWREIFPVNQSDTIFRKKDSTNENGTKTQISGAITTGYGGRQTDTYILLKDSVLRTGHAQAVIPPDWLIKRQNGRRLKEQEKHSFTLTTKDSHGVFDGKKIRRFTEIECERLQGFPDDWTRYGKYDGDVREIASTHRYRMCGNAVTKSMVELIGRKIKLNYEYGAE